MTFKVTDNNGEIFYINGAHIIYLKERKNYSLWKIVLSHGEAIMTKDGAVVQNILDYLFEKNS